MWVSLHSEPYYLGSMLRPLILGNSNIPCTTYHLPYTPCHILYTIWMARQREIVYSRYVYIYGTWYTTLAPRLVFESFQMAAMLRLFGRPTSSNTQKACSSRRSQRPVSIHNHPETDRIWGVCCIRNASWLFQRSCSIYSRMAVGRKNTPLQLSYNP